MLIYCLKKGFNIEGETQQNEIQGVYLELYCFNIYMAIYSRVPNKRPGRNKRPGWKILEKLIIVLGRIIVLGGKSPYVQIIITCNVTIQRNFKLMIFKY